MNADSASPLLSTDQPAAVQISSLEAEAAIQPPSAINGPIIGMALMASISLPLVCMAALRLRESQLPPASNTPVPAPVAAAAPQPVAVQPAAPQYVYWNYNFQAAQQLAAASNKSMMIDFYTDWCPACKNLDANVYAQPAIAAEAQNIVPVKINAEGQPDLAQRYNVTKYPTIIWTDSAGNEKFRQVGGSSAYDYLNTMVQNR